MQTVVYARRSAESGDDYSLTTQVEACQRYAAAHGLIDVAAVEENYTGTVPLAERPSGAAVWAAVMRKQARALVVYSLDRLSRADLVDALAMLREMMRAGCAIHTVDAGPIENLNDIGLIVRSWQSSEERRKIVDRLRRGKLGKSRSAWVGVGRTPYGYLKVGVKRTARLVINPDQAEVVRRVAQWVAEEGVPLREIARRLNAAGVPPPTTLSTHWTHGVISGVLANPVIAGRVRYLSNELHLPELAIVDPALYDRVRVVLDRNRAQATRNRRQDYLLAGRIVCQCGRPLIGTVRIKGERTYLYYYCAGAYDERGRTCANARRVRVIEADALAWQYVLACAQPERLAAWRAELHAQRGESSAAPLLERLAQIDRELDRARRRIAGIMAQFGDDARPAVAEQRDAAIDAANQVIEDRQAERAQVARQVEDEAGRLAQQTSALDAVDGLRRKLVRASFPQRRQVAAVIDLRARVSVCEDGTRAITLSSLIGPAQTFPLG